MSSASVSLSFRSRVVTSGVMNQQLNNDPYMVTLDASQKRIDVFHHETPPGTYGGKLKGIYVIDGDSLKVCYDLTGERYPTSLIQSRVLGKCSINSSGSDSRYLICFKI
jgi:uncharacterized protein (TIGR03067 family)